MPLFGARRQISSLDPFGNILSKSGPLADANSYRFSSQEYHQPSGLSLYLYRAYDPNLQRWINRDPVEDLGGINLYDFVANGPINEVDLEGLVEIEFSSGFPDFAKHNVLSAFGLWKRTLRGSLLDLQNPHKVVKIADIRERTRDRSTGCSVERGIIWLDTADPFFIDPESKRDMRNHGELPDVSARNLRNIGAAITLGHELGHALTKENDENEGGRNVQLNENPIREFYSVPVRTSYAGTPVPLPR